MARGEGKSALLHDIRVACALERLVWLAPVDKVGSESADPDLEEVGDEKGEADRAEDSLCKQMGVVNWVVEEDVLDRADTGLGYIMGGAVHDLKVSKE